MQRGTDGQWFAYRAAMTGSREECIAYAREFAAEQREAGVVATRITVQTRAGQNIFEARVNIYRDGGRDNTESVWEPAMQGGHETDNDWESTPQD
jgi:hypothetical protein